MGSPIYCVTFIRIISTRYSITNIIQRQGQGQYVMKGNEKTIKWVTCDEKKGAVSIALTGSQTDQYIH